MPFCLAIDEKKLTHAEAMAARDEQLWQSLETVTTGQGFVSWLESIPNKNTRASYKAALRQLVSLGILDPSLPIQELAMRAHNGMVDKIKQVEGWTEATKQARATALLSLFRFLHRRTDGLIRRLEPSREGATKTFYKIREKVSTPVMNQEQWKRWLKVLAERNPRDALIAKLAIQGAKRISEVLLLTTDQINWESCQIAFVQSKSKTERTTIITIPGTVIEELRHYIGERQGLVFITKSGAPIARNNLWVSFKRAGENARIPFVVGPHVLRASAITHMRALGFSTDEIAEVSGHATREMVAAYDKRSAEENVSKRLVLVE